MQLLAQDAKLGDPELLAKQFVDAEKGVMDIPEALAGASDIIAELVSDSPSIRKRLRDTATRQGKLSSEAAKEEDSVYSLYYTFSQPLSRLQGHQILAMNRGEKEGFFKGKL